jgi:hypothetical protein
MNIVLKSIPLLEYYGDHPLISDFYFEFKKRRIANDFSGKLEIFYEEILFNEKIIHKEKYDKDIKFHFLYKSCREKLTQLIISAVDVLHLINVAESNINELNLKKLETTIDHYRLKNLVETYIFILLSFLDVMSKINSYIYKLGGINNVPDKYGQQKYFDMQSGSFKINLILFTRINF